jgi:hypothetical protein
MAKQQNPNKKPLCPDTLFQPPESLVRPRNGDREGDALGIDEISGYDGGGKSPKPFIPIVDRPKHCDK